MRSDDHRNISGKGRIGGRGQECGPNCTLTPTLPECHEIRAVTGSRVQRFLNVSYQSCQQREHVSQPCGTLCDQTKFDWLLARRCDRYSPHSVKKSHDRFTSTCVAHGLLRLSKTVTSSHCNRLGTRDAHEIDPADCVRHLPYSDRQHLQCTGTIWAASTGRRRQSQKLAGRVFRHTGISHGRSTVFKRSPHSPRLCGRCNCGIRSPGLCRWQYRGHRCYLFDHRIARRSASAAESTTDHSTDWSLR
jgi:hypothetical protein